MTHARISRPLTVCSLAAALCGFAQGASAHTGVKDEGTEGKTLYTAFAITHGCASGTEGNTSPPIPVRAQGAVFPNSSDVVATKINPDPDGSGPLKSSEEPINLGDHIDVTTLSPGLVQSDDVFKKAVEVTAPGTTTVRAIHMTRGKLDTTLVGLTPFRVSAPSFKPDSCAKRLLVRIAVANWCNKSASSDDDSRVDVWMGRLTQKFNDVGVSSAESNGPGAEGFWTTLTINRTSALPQSCGGGYDIAVSPSDADIDAYLPIEDRWPANAN